MVNEIPLEDATATWRTRGQELAQSFKRQQWEIADWLTNGVALLHPELVEIDPRHALYPEKRIQTEVYDFAQRIFPDYTRETLRQFAYAARAFPPLTRVYANLSFGHYRAALSAEESARADWLAMADKGSWPVATLRLAIAEVAYRAAHEELGQADPTPEQDTPPPQRPKKSTSKVALSTIPFQSRIKLAALAQFHRIEPETLLIRIVNNYLEEHADDINATEQAAIEKMDQMSGSVLEPFEKEPEPDKEWLEKQAIAARERTEALKAEREEDRRKENDRVLAVARRLAEESEAIYKAGEPYRQIWEQIYSLRKAIDAAPKPTQEETVCVEPAVPEPKQEVAA